MAAMLNIAIKNHGCSRRGRSLVSSILGAREVVRSGVSCEVILTMLTDLLANVNVLLASLIARCDADHIFGARRPARRHRGRALRLGFELS